MANQTITTAVNYDDAAIAGLLNGETITNNGGSLTINSDVRWNQQAAVFGNVTCSTALGGNIYIDGRDVWELTYTASTGNVPAQTAIGTNGVTGGTSGATGELLRVWGTGGLDPVAAGGAMPATGWIKLRSKNGTFLNGEVVTLPGGATITINGAGRRSWISVVQAEATTITCSGLGAYNITGDWYSLGTTSGATGQTLQYPIIDYCPAIQIETSAGSGVYEWWTNGGDKWNAATQVIGTDERARFFGQNLTTGVITIAQRTGGSGNCGFLPPTGCAIRIPNVLLSNANSTNWATNTYKAGTNNRGLLSTINSAIISFDKCAYLWSLTADRAKSVTLTNMSNVGGFACSNVSSSTTITNLGNAYYANSGGVCSITSCNNLSIANSRIVNTAQGAALNITSCSDITITDSDFETFPFGTSQTRSTGLTTALNITSCANLTLTNVELITGYLQLQSCTDAVVTDTSYADSHFLTTQVSGGIACAIYIVNKCDNIEIVNFKTWRSVANVHPYNRGIYSQFGCTNITTRNIGTSAAPYNGGTSNSLQWIVWYDQVTNGNMRRIYTTNVTSVPVIAVNCYNIRAENIYLPYARQFNSSASNALIRGWGSTYLISSQPACVGWHWFDCFDSATTGKIIAVPNAPTAFSTDQIVTSFTGNSNFTGAGTVTLKNVNDYCEWIHTYFVLGHTAFQNTAPVITATNSGNHSFTFQYDTGSGWNGTYLTLNAANLSGIGAISPTTGVKLKIRATCTVAANNNEINYIEVRTTTTASDQLTLYPLPFDGTGSIENLLTGSRIQIYNTDNSTELVNTTVSGTSYTYEYYSGTQIAAGDIVRIRVSKLGYLPQTLIAIATATGFAAAANYVADAIYNANGIDGSTVTEFTADYPNIDLDINDPDQITTVQRIYAFLRYTETTQDGIDKWFDVVDPTDEVNYEIDATKLNLKFDNTQATPVVIGGGRIYRSDGATIIEGTSGSIQMDPQRVYQSDATALAADVWSYGSRTLTSSSDPTPADIWAYATRTLTADSGPTAIEIADTVLRRSTANVEASGTGDAINIRSLYGMIAQAVHNTRTQGTKLVVTKSDDTTQLATRTLTTNPSAEPITGIDSD